MGLYDMPINNLNKLIASGAVQATEVVEDVFDRIEQVEGKVRAYLTLNKEAALQQARRIDEQVAHGEDIDPLAGVPVALKDNICTKGLRTTCASRFLSHFNRLMMPRWWKRLRARGAVILGKTNMDEFAMGSSCENSAFFPTHNPWDLQRAGRVQRRVGCRGGRRRSGLCARF